MIAADDPRRQAVLELRARQILALSLEPGDHAGMGAVWALALAELGDGAAHELLGTALGLVGWHVEDRAAFANRVRGPIPKLLESLEKGQHS